ncbi:MAG: tetratricopeptide repeat protein [Lentisphaerae bacterium]|nr:tetratricopeptide repeat protein [Lentisphaerota bacterium]
MATPRDPSAKSSVLPKIVLIAFILLIVLLAVGGVIGAKFLKDNESKIVAAVSRRENPPPRPAGPPVSPPTEHPPPKVEVNAVTTYGDGHVSAQLPPPTAPSATIETETGNGKFITAIEVVTEVKGDPPKEAGSTTKPVTVDLPATVVGSGAKPPVKINVETGGSEKGVTVALPQRYAPVSVDITRRTGSVPGSINLTGTEDVPEPLVTTEAVPFVRDFDRAVSLQRAGELDQALEYYGRYLERRPGHAGSYNNMGVIYQAKEEFSRAVKAYSDAIAAEPDNHRTYNNLASCYMALGEPARAVEALTRSLHLEEDNLPALINMGVAQTALDDFRAAERFLNRAMERYPDEPRTVYNLGNLFRWRGQTGRAAEYYERFLKTSSGKYASQEKQVRRYLKKLGESE